MTVAEIIMTGGLGLIIILSLIKIKPLEISPWKAIGRAIGRSINGEVLEKVATMQGDVTELKTEISAVKADVNSVKQDVSAVQSDVTKLTSDLSVVKLNLDGVKDDVAALDLEVKRNAIVNCRYRILRFGDELFHGTNHTEEHYKQILMDIDKYNNYCKLDPDFENNITSINTKKILDEYAKRIETGDFL